MQKLLGHLSVLAHRSDQAERRILERAQAREGEVQEKLDALRPLAMGDDGAAQEYQSLVRERATLARVIETAKGRVPA